MKLSFAILTATAATETAWASCNSNQGDKFCENYSGECTKAVELFLNGAGRSAINTVSIGKFCGNGNNKCPGSNNAADPAIAAPGVDKLINITACDVNILDGGCKAHDTCLDDAGNDPGSDPVPLPDRCPCDLDYLINLATASQVDGCAGAKLCDKDFYTKAAYPIDTPLLTWEEVLKGTSLCAEPTLLAAPFCNNFFEPPVGDAGACVNGTQQVNGVDLYTPQQQALLPLAVGFCGGILSALGPLLP